MKLQSSSSQPNLQLSTGQTGNSEASDDCRRTQSQPSKYMELTPPRRRRLMHVRGGKREERSCSLETRSLPPPSPTREDLTDDLVSYLTDLRTKKDEDGRPAVFFPSNYEDVLSLMTRPDITIVDSPPQSPLPKAAAEVARGAAEHSSAGTARGDGSEEKEEVHGGHHSSGSRSWVHYVLEDGLPGSADKEYNGDEEAIILKGLAKIKQLDLQLRQKAREERNLRLQAAADLESSRNDLAALIQSMHWDSIPRKAFFTEHRTASIPTSPLSTSRTTMSDVINGRTTFLTDGARDRGQGRGDETMALPPSEASTTPRSGRIMTGRSRGSSSSSRPAAAVGESGRDFIRDNIELAREGFRSHLTKEEECRYRELLHQEEGPETVESPYVSAPPSSRTAISDGSSCVHVTPRSCAAPREYGLSTFEQERLRIIDSQLKELPLASLTGTETTVTKKEGQEREDADAGSKVWEEALDSMDGGPSTSTFRAYLRDERDRRLAELRLLQIEAMLLEYQKIAPLPSASVSTTSEDCSILNSGRSVGAAACPSTPARSEASEAIAMHSARSVRRPIQKDEVEAVVCSAKRDLGAGKPTEKEREKIAELLSQLKALGLGQDTVSTGHQKLLERVSLSIEKSRRELHSATASCQEEGCVDLSGSWASAAPTPRFTTTATGCSPQRAMTATSSCPSEPGEWDTESQSLDEVERVGDEAAPTTAQDPPIVSF